MTVMKNRRKMMCLVLAASMVFTMAGCGKGSGGSDDVSGSVGQNTDAPEDGQGKVNGGDNGPTAMGRYVEEEIDLSEQSIYPMDLCVREDGSLVILNQETGTLVSGDQGVTWESETPDWYKTLR